LHRPFPAIRLFHKIDYMITENKIAEASTAVKSETKAKVNA